MGNSASSAINPNASARPVNEIRCYERDPSWDINKAHIQDLVSMFRNGTLEVDYPNPITTLRNSPDAQYYEIKKNGVSVFITNYRAGHIYTEDNRNLQVQVDHEAIAKTLEMVQDRCCPDSSICPTMEIADVWFDGSPPSKPELFVSMTVRLQEPRKDETKPTEPIQMRI